MLEGDLLKQRRPARGAALLRRVLSLWMGLWLAACGAESPSVDSGMGAEDAGISMGDAPATGPAPLDATLRDAGTPEGGPASADGTNGSSIADGTNGSSVSDGTNGSADTSPTPDATGAADAPASRDVTVAESLDSSELDIVSDVTATETSDDVAAYGADAATGSVSDGEVTIEAATETAADASRTSVASVCVSPCGPGENLCAGQCVSASDPDFGCNPNCFPCQVAHATPTCAGNACAIKDCEPGWADLDGVADDGCEADVTGPLSCTAANLQCAAGEVCTSSGCAATCDAPLTNCNGACVDLSTSSQNCGSCFHSCDDPNNGVFTCSNGVCSRCAEGTTLCNGEECTDTTRDPQNCGACGNACPSPGLVEHVSMTGSPVGVSAQCVDSHCTGGCGPGWTLCQECAPAGSPDFGYCDQECVVTATDANNCGACNHPCATGQVCVQSACVPATSIWLASGLASPEAIVIDADAAYFTDSSAGTVSSVPKAGGPVTVLATGQTQLQSIALDDTIVYWAAASDVWRIQKAPGDTPHLVASIAASVGDIAVDETFVYMLSGVVYRAPKDGSGASEPFSRNIVMGATNSFSAMRYDGVGLYTLGFTSANTTQYIWNIDLSTGLASGFSEVHEMTTLAVGYGWVGGESAPQNAIFWSAPYMANPGSDIHTYASVNTLAPAPCGFVWAGSGYTLNSPVSAPAVPPIVGPNGLVVSTIGGGPEASVVATALPNQIVVDADSTVYWTDQSGAIGRAPLP